MDKALTTRQCSSIKNLSLASEIYNAPSSHRCNGNFNQNISGQTQTITGSDGLASTRRIGKRWAILGNQNLTGEIFPEIIQTRGQSGKKNL